MGFFSKTCAKTHLPIVSHYKDIPRLSEVVALLPNGKKFTGSYDGYGRVAGTGLVETARGRYQWPEVKMVRPSTTTARNIKTWADQGTSWHRVILWTPCF